MLHQKLNDPHSTAKYQYQLATTRAAYGLVSIKTSRANHGGHHAGILEAESEGLDQANLARMGRWNHDKMTVYYLSGLAVPGAFTSAGFHDEPYVLDHDCNVPPVELQRLIFPWIESQFPENPNWVNECNDTMMDAERSGTSITEDILATDPSISLDPSPPSAHAQMEVAKYSLLHLLLYLRRVILQDAVMFINAGGNDTLLMMHPILQSATFHVFKEQLLQKMASTPALIHQFQDIIPDLVEVLELNRKDTAQILSQVCCQQELDSLQLHFQGKQQQWDHEAIQSLMKKQEDYNEHLQSSLDSLLRNQERAVLEYRR